MSHPQTPKVPSLAGASKSSTHVKRRRPNPPSEPTNVDIADSEDAAPILTAEVPTTTTNLRGSAAATGGGESLVAGRSGNSQPSVLVGGRQTGVGHRGKGVAEGSGGSQRGSPQGASQITITITDEWDVRLTDSQQQQTYFFPRDVLAHRGINAAELSDENIQELIQMAMPSLISTNSSSSPPSAGASSTMARTRPRTSISGQGRPQRYQPPSYIPSSSIAPSTASSRVADADSNHSFHHRSTSAVAAHKANGHGGSGEEEFYCAVCDRSVANQAEQAFIVVKIPACLTCSRQKVAVVEPMEEGRGGGDAGRDTHAGSTLPPGTSSSTPTGGAGRRAQDRGGRGGGGGRAVGGSGVGSRGDSGLVASPPSGSASDSDDRRSSLRSSQRRSK